MSTASVSLDLTGPQLQALIALLAGRSMAEAAEASNASQHTLRDWLQQPAFRAAFLQGQQQRFHQISMQLADAASRALRTLLEISEDPDQKGSVRVAAAQKVMHLFLHHGPRVSALLAAPETPEALQEDVVTKARAYDSIVASLDKIYGSHDDDQAVAVDTPVPPAGLGASTPQPEPEPQPPACAGHPAAAAAPAPQDTPPPTRLSVPTRIPAETPAPLPAPDITYVPWRG